MKIFLLIVALSVSSIDAFTINCSFINFVWPSIGVQYTCMVHPSLSVRNPNAVATGVRGVHLPGRSNADVRMVNFHGVDDLVVVPRGMSNFLPNIHAIRIYDSDVRNLVGNELNEYTNLRWFSVFDSYVNTIPSNFFSHNPNMIYVAFDANYVQTVGSGLFDPIRNVRSMSYMGFLSNRCINMSGSNGNQIDRVLERLNSHCSGSSSNTSPATTTTTRGSSPTTSRSSVGSSSSTSPSFTTSRSSSAGSSSSSSPSFTTSRSSSAGSSSSSSPSFTTSGSSGSSSSTSRSFSRSFSTPSE